MGRGYVDLRGDGADVELVAHRVGTLLGHRLHAVSPTTIDLVDPVDAETRARLAAWLCHQDPTP